MVGNAISGEDLKTDYPEITPFILLLVHRFLRYCASIKHAAGLLTIFSLLVESNRIPHGIF
jgi:hypothetical protein